MGLRLILYTPINIRAKLLIYWFSGWCVAGYWDERWFYDIRDL